MRIVQATPRYPPHTGGVETHVRELAERLTGRGHDVTVLTADAGDDVPTRERRDGVTVRRRRGLAPGGAYHLAPGLLRAVREHSREADVVHAHNYHSLVPPLAAAGARSRAPLAVTAHYHGASDDAVRDRLLSAYAPVGGRVLRSADACLAVSDWERERLRADFAVAATVVPNGVDVDRFRGAAPVDRERPYLLSVGRLERYKGVQHVVRALVELPAYDLLVAGDGDHRSTLARVADRAGVRDRVEFLGYVADDRLPGLYAGAAALVTLSTFEAYGMTVGEALASGTPAVVLTERALADWTDHAGVVGVDRVDPETVAAAVADARDREPDPSALPTWADTTDGVEAVYERL